MATNEQTLDESAYIDKPKGWFQKVLKISLDPLKFGFIMVERGNDKL